MYTINPAEQPILTATTIVLLGYLLIRATSSRKPKLVVQPWNSRPMLNIKEMIYPPEEDPWKRLVTNAQDPRNYPLCVIPGIFSRTPNVLVNDVDMMKEILVQGQSYSHGEPKMARSKTICDLNCFLFGGWHIGNTSGQAWKWRHEAYSPLFQPRFLVPALLPYIIERVNKLNEELAKFAATGEAVEFDGRMSDVTLDIICKYIFGYAGEELDFQDVKGKENITNDINSLFKGVASIYPRIPIIKHTEWGQRGFKPSRDRLIAFTDRAIKKSLAQPGLFLDSTADKPHLHPLVHELAKNTNFEEGTDHSLGKDILIIIFAGHDTTSHTASFAFGSIAQHPEVQQRLFEEIRGQLGPGPIDLAASTTESLGSMMYLTAVIKEVMRMYPIANFLVTEVLKDTVLGGMALPSGTLLLTNFRGAQMNPNLFPNPEKFDPTRWLEHADADAFQDVDRTATKSSKPELVFGLGPHACLGRNLAWLELRILIATIVNKFELKLKEGTTIDTYTVFTMMPKDGVWVTLKERD